MLDDLNLPALGDLEDAWQEVDEARALRETADTRTMAALQKVQDALVTLALQIGDDEALRATVVQQLYWRETGIKSTWLAEAFGLKIYQLVALAGGASLPVQCSRCGVEYRIAVTSRTNMEESLRRHRSHRGGWASLCDTCQAVVNSEHHAQAEQRRAAMQQRLRQLQAMPYHEYVQTPEWQARREEQLDRAGYRCQVCNAGETQLEVHHRTYQHRGRESFIDLIVLCTDCHALFHEQGKLAQDDWNES